MSRDDSYTIVDVITQPNLLYIVRFGPYRSHSFALGDVSLLLSLTPQNTYDKLITNTLNKAIYHSLTHRCGILQSTPLRSPTILSAQPDNSEVGSDTKSNSSAQPTIYCSLWALPPSWFCSWWCELNFEPEAPKRVWQVGN